MDVMQPLSSKVSATGKMRYVMALLGCAGVTLINFLGEDRQFLYYQPHPQIFLDMIYYIALVQLYIPIAILAERMSAKWLMVITLIAKVTSVLLMSTNQFILIKFFILGKVLQAFVDASYFSIMHLFISRWSPPKERSFIASIIYAGIPMGQLLTSGGLFLVFHYQVVPAFCILGILSFLWIVIWCLLIEDTPDAQKHGISQNEKTYILESLEKSESEYNLQRQSPFPFTAVFTSKPFWVLLIVHCCIDGGLTIVQNLAVYKSWNVIGFSRGMNLTFPPQLFMLIFMMILGYTMSFNMKKDKITLTRGRKIATMFALITMTIPLLMMCTDSIGWLIILRIIGIMFYGAVYSGFMINHIDLAPNFAATLLSITMTVAVIVRLFITYFLVFQLGHNQIYPYGWLYIIGMVLIFIIAIVLYCRFGSAEEQSWNINLSRCGNKIGHSAHETLQTLLPTSV